MQQNFRHLQGVQTKVPVLKVSEIKITTENFFNQDHLGIEASYEWYIGKKFLH